jgi:hypothetical protein
MQEISDTAVDALCEREPSGTLHRTGRQHWLLVMLWAFFLVLVLTYGAIAMSSTGTPIRDIKWSWPRTGDSLEIGVTLLAIFHLLQVVHLFRKMGMFHRPDIRQRKRLSVPGLVAPWLVRWAILSAISVDGLVLVFVAHDSGKLLPFLVVSVLGYAMSFPSRRRQQLLRLEVDPARS